MGVEEVLAPQGGFFFACLSFFSVFMSVSVVVLSHYPLYSFHFVALFDIPYPRSHIRITSHHIAHSYKPFAYYN